MEVSQLAENEKDEYLTGFLTVFFGCDVVSLVHKVHGRFSIMDLGDGDCIEVKDGDDYKVITIQDALTKIVKKHSKKLTKWNEGQSSYEDDIVRVKLNQRTTLQMLLANERYHMRELFKAVEEGYLSHEEAMRTIVKWNFDYGD